MCISQSQATVFRVSMHFPLWHIFPHSLLHNNHKLLSAPWCVSLLGLFEAYNGDNKDPSGLNEISASPLQTWALPQARVSVYMDTLKHLSSDYELINANVSHRTVWVQHEQKDKENRGEEETTMFVWTMTAQTVHHRA